MEVASVAIPIESVVRLDQACEFDDRLLRVFRNISDGLYRWVLVRVAGDRHAADDLLQQTCHEAARQRRRPTDDEKYEAWFRGIARNLVRRHWRQAKRRGRPISLENATVAAELADDLDSRPLPPDAMIREESVRQLLLAVTSLPAADQRLVFAFYFENRSQADMADNLQTSVKSIETRLYRLRNRLRAILKHIERT